MRQRVAMRPLWAAAAVGLALAAGLAGCTGGGEPAPAPADAVSPLDEFRDVAYGSGLSIDEQRARAAALTQAYNEAIASCMADKGFDYQPGGAGAVFVLDAADISEEDTYGTLEFAKLYGYGITEYPAALTVRSDETTMPDPNADYVAAMTDAERDAYFLALEGEQPDASAMAQDEGEGPTWQVGGCRAQASEEVPGFDGADDGPYEQLTAAMSQVSDVPADDPELAEANAAWAQCMAEAGYAGYSAVGEPEDELSRRLNAVLSEGIPLDVDQQTYPPLVEIREQEIATATADFTCRDTVGYEAAKAAVRNQREQEFVDQHRTELTQWATWMAASAQAAIDKAEPTATP